MPNQFDHEKLKVYQESHHFAAIATSLLDRIPKGTAVLVVKKLLLPSDIADGKQVLIGVVSMLVGLTKAIAPNRVQDEVGDYGEV